MLSRRFVFSCSVLLLIGSFYILPATRAADGNSQGSQDSQVEIEPRDPRTQIRAQLLKYTPLGSSSKDVLAFIKNRLKPDNADKVAIENKPADGQSAESSDKRGTKRIKLVLGPYLTSPGLILLDIPLPLRNTLTVQWAFDKNDKLVEIFLDRESR